MSSPVEMFAERAAECRREADATKQTNVRDRCLRSALAWEEIANRLRTTETYRLSEIKRKAALANEEAQPGSAALLAVSDCFTR